MCLAGRDESPQGAPERQPPANVSQAAGSPVEYPFLNQLERCSADPCVQVSGFTAAPALAWMRSSPTAEAACRPSSMSPSSRSPAW